MATNGKQLTQEQYEVKTVLIDLFEYFSRNGRGNKERLEELFTELLRLNER